jgi:hypothetical protein
MDDKLRTPFWERVFGKREPTQLKNTLSDNFEHGKLNDL